MKITLNLEITNLKFIFQCKLIKIIEIFSSLTVENAQSVTPDNKKTLGEQIFMMRFRDIAPTNTR